MNSKLWAMPAVIIAGLAFAQRADAVTITWTGSAGTNSWHAPTNWDLNRVPGAGDDVVIPDMTPNVSVTYSTGSTTINSLLSAEAVSLAAGTLTINSPSTLNGPFALIGTLAGTGDVIVNGPMSWTGNGQMTGTGRTIIAAGASLSIADAGDKFLRRLLQNHSTNATWTGGRIKFDNGTLSNEADGVLTANSSGDNASDNGSGTNAINNLGIWIKSGSAVLFHQVPFNNNGTVHIDAGTLELITGTNSGIIDADPGATLKFSGTYSHGPASSLTGEGRLSFTGGVHSFSGTLGTNRIVDIKNGATVDFNAAYTFAGILNLGPGVTFLGGSGDLTVTGTLNWTSGGRMRGTGRTIIADGGVLDINGGDKDLFRTLENHSSNANWTDGTIRFLDGRFKNESSGVFTASSASNVRLTQFGGTNAVINAGSFTKIGSSTLDVDPGVPFTNNGTLKVAAGTVVLNGGLTNLSGTTLSGGTYDLAGALKIPNANIVTNAANVILDGPAAAIQNTSGGNGIANIATNTAAGTFQVKNGGNYSSVGPFHNIGLVMLGPGESTFSVNSVVNNGTFTKLGTGTGNVSTIGQFTNSATIDVQAGTMIMSSLANQSGNTLNGGTFIIAGVLRYANASVGTNEATIVLDGPASAIQSTSGTNALGNIVTNAATGSIQIKNDRNLALPGTFTNLGQMRIGPGNCTLSDTGNYLQSSGATVLDGGTLDPTDLADFQGGELRGSGLILGNVKSSGACRPGNLAITGDYTQDIQGSLEEQIGGVTAGAEYGRLAVTGTALLAGAFNVTLINGFVPSVGDAFDVLSGNLVELKFATIDLPLLPSLKGWHFDNVPNELRLAVIDCGPGDADGDGVGDACETAPDLSWFTIDGGGGTSSGGIFKLSATIGQPDACSPAEPMTGGIFTLVGGFWAGVETVDEPACTLPGDMNLDGLRNGKDIQTFSACVISGTPQGCDCADVNNSGAADAGDINPFVQLLIN